MSALVTEFVTSFWRVIKVSGESKAHQTTSQGLDKAADNILQKMGFKRSSPGSHIYEEGIPQNGSEFILKLFTDDRGRLKMILHRCQGHSVISTVSGVLRRLEETSQPDEQCKTAYCGTSDMDWLKFWIKPVSFDQVHPLVAAACGLESEKEEVVEVIVRSTTSSNSGSNGSGPRKPELVPLTSREILQAIDAIAAQLRILGDSPEEVRLIFSQLTSAARSICRGKLDELKAQISTLSDRIS